MNVLLLKKKNSSVLKMNDSPVLLITYGTAATEAHEVNLISI